MGASSSSVAHAAHPRERRKSTEEGGAAILEADKRAKRLLLQNGLLTRKSKAGSKSGVEQQRSEELNNTASGRADWKKKAHSMYDLQQMREKSTEVEPADVPIDEANATSGGKTQVSDAKKSRRKGQHVSLVEPLAASTAAGPADPTSPSLSVTPPGHDPAPVSGSNSPTTVPPASILKTSQRRRPLTWAWIRGHDAGAAPPADPHQTQAPASAPAVERRERATSGRRRSLKAGHDGLCSTTYQRQSSCTHSPDPVMQHAPLGRRSSQAGNPPFAQSARQKSVRKSDAMLPNNPISAPGREIIQFCFDNPHNEIGNRICSRLLEKRNDFRQFAYSMGKERWQQMTGRLKEFLESVVRKLDSIETVERLSRKYGEEHVELKCFGFKPDFWVSLADAITVECVILDQATHQPSDTITAWSLLVSIMFSAVRDGYYQAMRAQRISQRHRNVQQRENSFNLTHQLSTAGVEKSSSTTAIESPTRRNSGIKYLNQLEEQHEHIVVSTTPVAIASEEKIPVPVQFF